jgi:hypothetical protein
MQNIMVIEQISCQENIIEGKIFTHDNPLRAIDDASNSFDKETGTIDYALILILELISFGLEITVN